MKPRRELIWPAILACLCAAFALRDLASPPQAPQLAFQEWQKPGGGPQSYVPDLHRGTAVELSWLPGVGPGRAQAILEHRASLEVPLTPQRLALLPEIGEVTASKVERWYRRHAP